MGDVPAADDCGTLGNRWIGKSGWTSCVKGERSLTRLGQWVVGAVADELGAEAAAGASRRRSGLADVALAAISAGGAVAGSDFRTRSTPPPSLQYSFAQWLDPGHYPQPVLNKDVGFGPLTQLDKRIGPAHVWWPVVGLQRTRLVEGQDRVAGTAHLAVNCIGLSA